MPATPPRRYRLRPGSVALTRGQWVVVVAALLAAAAGVVLLATDTLVGALLLAAGGVGMSLVVLLALASGAWHDR